MTQKTTNKSKEENCIAIMPRLVVYGYALSVPASKIQGVDEKVKPAAKFYLQQHIPPVPILLRKFKHDQGLYRVINSRFSSAQIHLARLKPDVHVQAFIMESKSETEDLIDDFIFGEVLSAMPKPMNQEVTKSIVSKLLESPELLAAVVEGFELAPRSKDQFPTNEIADLLNISPQAVRSKVEAVLLESKWNNYATKNNMHSYEVMTKALAKNKKFKTAFINKLREHDVDSPLFREFAARAARSISDLPKGDD